MRRFNSIFLVPFTLLFSLAASYLIMAVSGQNKSVPEQPLPNYHNLYNNYRIFKEFIDLPVPTTTFQVEDIPDLNPPPFITHLLLLNAAANDFKEKKYMPLQSTLDSITPQHPFLIEKKRKLYLQNLYIQKNYQEFIQQCKTNPPTTLETKLFLLDSYSKTGITTPAFAIFQELFPTEPLLTLEKYLSRSQLNLFIKKIDYPTWFKKLQFLVKNNRYSAFQNAKKYINSPQLVALIQAEFQYNSKAYSNCKKSLLKVTNKELAPYKKHLLLKIQLRDKQYDSLFESLAELETEPELFLQALQNCAGILMIDGETDLALKVFSQYIQSIKAIHFSLNILLNKNDIVIHDENYWKSLWLCAWLNYQKNEKVAAIAFFKEGIHATELSFKIANRYWLQRLAPQEAEKEEVNLDQYPFTYYYTRENPGKESLTKSIQPFMRMLNHPQSVRVIAEIDTLKTMVHYNLLAEACNLIKFTLRDPAFSIADKHVLKILQSILYIKQGNENMAFNRFRNNFESYLGFLLPRFLRQIVMPVKYESIVQKYGEEHNIDSELLFSLIREESFFRADVVSYAKAYGLMQLLLPTARQMALPYDIKLFVPDLYNPNINIRFGTQYLRLLLDKYNGKVHLALAAYNAGDFRVDKWLNRFGDVADDEFIEMIPFTATRTYVKNILRNYYFYRFYYGKESRQ